MRIAFLLQRRLHEHDSMLCYSTLSALLLLFVWVWNFVSYIREEPILRVFQETLLKRFFGSKRVELWGFWLELLD